LPFARIYCYQAVDLAALNAMEALMTDKRVFIEQRPEARDYAVRKPGSGRASAVLPTQADAIEWARQRNADIFVERVRDTKIGSPDKWRRP
jgi:hypothetical protein